MTITLPVRVMVEDAWDQVALNLPPETSLESLKQRALQLTHVTGSPDSYLVKYRGAELRDEQRSLAEAGVVRNATLIVLPRRRRPVR